MITNAQLIAHLQTLPQDVLVVYDAYSEHNLLTLKEVHVAEFQPPRADGWVGNARPDKPKQVYISFPGN